MECRVEAIEHPAKKIILPVLVFATLSLYNDYIISFELLLQEIRSDLSKTKAKVSFIDNSVLFLREIIIDNVLFDYSYHWQTEYEVLIIRWDNTAHFPDINISSSQAHWRRKQCRTFLRAKPSSSDEIYKEQTLNIKM